MKIDQVVLGHGKGHWGLLLTPQNNGVNDKYTFLGTLRINVDNASAQYQAHCEQSKCAFLSTIFQGRKGIRCLKGSSCVRYCTPCLHISQNPDKHCLPGFLIWKWRLR